MLIKPIVTEKSMLLAQKGQFTFEVVRLAAKTKVAQAVEALFSVKVVKVRLLKTAGKTKRSGKKGLKTRVSPKTKAIVTLQPGQKIEYFELPKAKTKKKTA